MRYTTLSHRELSSLTRTRSATADEDARRSEWKSSQKLSAQPSAVRSIAWLDSLRPRTQEGHGYGHSALRSRNSRPPSNKRCGSSLIEMLPTSALHNRDCGNFSCFLVDAKLKYACPRHALHSSLPVIGELSVGVRPKIRWRFLGDGILEMANQQPCREERKQTKRVHRSNEN
jgi:hypothetical protein